MRFVCCVCDVCWFGVVCVCLLCVRCCLVCCVVMLGCVLCFLCCFVCCIVLFVVASVLVLFVSVLFSVSVFGVWFVVLRCLVRGVVCLVCVFCVVALPVVGLLCVV